MCPLGGRLFFNCEIGVLMTHALHTIFYAFSRPKRTLLVIIIGAIFCFETRVSRVPSFHRLTSLCNQPLVSTYLRQLLRGDIVECIYMLVGCMGEIGCNACST